MLIYTMLFMRKGGNMKVNQNWTIMFSILDEDEWKVVVIKAPDEPHYLEQELEEELEEDLYYRQLSLFDKCLIKAGKSIYDYHQACMRVFKGRYDHGWITAKPTEKVNPKSTTVTTKK